MKLCIIENSIRYMFVYWDTVQTCKEKFAELERKYGWKAGKGTNVINVYSFLGEETA